MQIYFVASNIAQNSTVCLPHGSLFILSNENTLISELLIPQAMLSTASHPPPERPLWELLWLIFILRGGPVGQ